MSKAFRTHQCRELKDLLDSVWLYALDLFISILPQDLGIFPLNIKARQPFTLALLFLLLFGGEALTPTVFVLEVQEVKAVHSGNLQSRVKRSKSGFLHPQIAKHNSQPPGPQHPGSPQHPPGPCAFLLAVLAPQLPNAAPSSGSAASRTRPSASAAAAARQLQATRRSAMSERRERKDRAAWRMASGWEMLGQKNWWLNDLEIVNGRRHF